MSDFQIPQIDAAALAAMTGDEVIEAFGGFDAAMRLYAQGAYLVEQPLKCRADLVEFARYLMPDPNHPMDAAHSRYHVARHHKLIAEALERVKRGEWLRLIISVPPQHGKSQLGKTFLADHAGAFPWKHLMMGTYNQDFANEYGDDTRNILRSEEFQRVYPAAKLRTGSKAKDHMVMTEGGKLSFLGRGGSGTGRPADGFLIDDPFKDATEAGSKAIRDTTWEWYTRVANSRCHALTWQVIIATRWSDDDIIARLTDPQNPYYKAEVAAQWKVINIPAEIDTQELATALGVKVGDALWPERFPLTLLHTARAMDPIGYSALYMGRPTPPEGSFYRSSDLGNDVCYTSRLQFPRNARMYQTGDLGVSKEAYSNRSCIGLWGLDEHDVLWLHWDLLWDKFASDESVEKMIDQGKEHNIFEAWFEKGQLEKAIGPFLQKRMEERGAYWSITALPVAGNKGLRSQSFRARLRQGKVRFPSFMPWWPRFLEVMLKFTGSGDDKEDDACDMCALIGQALGETIAASKNSGHSNIIKMPKVGTFGWTVEAHRREQKRAKAVKALRGM